MIKKTDTLLYEALIEKGLSSYQILQPLLKEADTSGGSLQELLVKRSLFPERDILNILAEKLKLTYLNLNGLSVDNSVIEKVPVKVASYYKFFPVKIEDRVLTIAVSFPPDIKMQDELRTQLGYTIEVVFSCQNEISSAIRKYYGLVAETMEKISQQGNVVAEGVVTEAGMNKVEDIEKQAEDASVMKLVNQIILDAYMKRATDIHIEPFREEVSLRYRIDSVLYDAKVPQEIKNFLNAIISRIKIMSSLNIVERRLPQDGRAVVRVNEQMLDLRISTMPTPYGESVVIRILPAKMLFSLERLGLSKEYLQVFENLIQKPHGIIFVTGPTGSGKTTTLYACLNRINGKERKIITIEDPIEYEMSGITQIQVMPEIGLDFARGLRSILRHDPDIIMVGEVRDFETAEIAIRVALTGHLVFSTLHTNDAASGITRLIDIGVEPYLVASSIEAFIAQRLIRVICQDCKYEDDTLPQELREIIAEDLGVKSVHEVKVYKGKGCPNCNFTGYFGRTAIYEILLIDAAIRDLILKKAASSQIKDAAMSRGMRTLRQDGWLKVLAGVTTPQEVMKVTSSEETKEAVPQVSGIELPNEEVPFEGIEKRAFIRLNSRTKVHYKVFKSQEELSRKSFIAQQQSMTKDISAGGLLFLCDEPLSCGIILELNIELPHTQECIECLSRVVRTEETVVSGKYSIAVCFLDITGAQRARLNKYVETG